MFERDWPEGHPSASDFDAVKDRGKYVPPAPYVRDWPKGHPAAADTLGLKPDPHAGRRGPDDQVYVVTPVPAPEDAGGSL